MAREQRAGLSQRRISLRNPDKYFDLVSQATYVQSAINDSTSQTGQTEDPHALADALCRAGARIAFVTRGKFGALALQGETAVSVPAMGIEVTDAQGAGATFSAAAMYGLLQSWPLERIVRFATRRLRLSARNLGY